MKLDLSCVIQILEEALDLAENLDGQELDETDATSNQSKGEARRARTAMSTDLSVLADHCGLVQFLTRDIYWSARGRGANIETAVILEPDDRIETAAVVPPD